MLPTAPLQGCQYTGIRIGPQSPTGAIRFAEFHRGETKRNEQTNPCEVAPGGSLGGNHDSSRGNEKADPVICRDGSRTIAREGDARQFQQHLSSGSEKAPRIYLGEAAAPAEGHAGSAATDQLPVRAD